jgi:hypothetical protein
MIRNTLLGNEVSTPRAKGVQAVSVSKICEGHVSRISQSLQNASSSKGVRPGLILGAKLFRRTLLEGVKNDNVLAQGSCLHQQGFLKRDWAGKGLASSNTYY